MDTATVTGFSVWDIHVRDSDCGQLYNVTETKGENTILYLYQDDILGNLVGSGKLVGSSPAAINFLVVTYDPRD